MRVYKKDMDKTANTIAEIIKKSDEVATYERISKETYDWLYMNANPIAYMVEKLLNHRYVVGITREKENGEYFMHIGWYVVTPLDEPLT